MKEFKAQVESMVQEFSKNIDANFFNLKSMSNGVVRDSLIGSVDEGSCDGDNCSAHQLAKDMSIHAEN